MTSIFDIDVGDTVFKLKGYKFPGVVVAKFKTTKGHIRYVVECTVPECAGMLHVYRGDDLMKGREQ